MSRKEEIIAEASTLFVEKGYYETSMDDIAARVGIKKPTLYYYIPGKEAILTEIFHQAMRYELSFFREVHEKDATLPPSEKLHRLIREHVNLLATRHEVVTIFFQELKKVSPKEKKKLGAVAREVESVVDEIVTEGIKLGQFRKMDPRIATLTIFGVLNWPHRWYRPDGRLNPEELAEELYQFVINGLLAKD